MLSREGIRGAAETMVAEGDPFLPGDAVAAEAVLTAWLADPAVQIFGNDDGFVAVAPTAGEAWREVAHHGDTSRASRDAAEWLRANGVPVLLNFGTVSYGCVAKLLRPLMAAQLWRSTRELDVKPKGKARGKKAVEVG